MNAIEFATKQTTGTHISEKTNDNKEKNTKFDSLLKEQEKNYHSLEPKDKDQLSMQKNKSRAKADVNHVLQLTLGQQGKLQLNSIMHNLSDVETPHEKLEALAAQAEVILSNIDGEDDLEEAATELLQLLETWEEIGTQTLENLNTEKDDNINDFLAEINNLLKAKLDEKDFSNEENNNYYALLKQLENADLDRGPNQKETIQLLQNLKVDIEQLDQSTKLSQRFVNQLQALLSTIETQWYKNDIQSEQLSIMKNQNLEEDSIWEELIKKYQNKKGTESNNRINTSVEKKDVLKWLSQALETQSSKVNRISHAGLGFANMPMSKVEQYAIYMNQSQNAPPIEQQLVEEFQQVIQKSQFISQPNGRMQLSIMLRPDNLGEMMVRLVQIDGEMTVKIAVSTHAAKEMLEKNIHQLRNVFSPHQVIIERQELNVSSSSELHHEQTDEETNEQHQEEKQNDDDNQNEDEHFKSFFEEILMNEKV